MAPVPTTPAAEAVELRVVRLLASWRAETAHLSSSTRMTEHPAYQELIALGPAALPFRNGHLSSLRSIENIPETVGTTGSPSNPPLDRLPRARYFVSQSP